MKAFLYNLVAVALLGGLVQAASKPAETCPAERSNGAGGCVGKKEMREAEAAFARGLKLEKGERKDEALLEFERAASLLPRNLEYVTAREVARQQQVYAHIESGNQAMQMGESAKALAEFRTALELDPTNEFAGQRLKDALGSELPKVSPGLRLVAQADEIEAQPQAGLRSFHYRGDTRGLMAEIAGEFGLSVVFDDTVQTKPVRFEVEQVGFERAMEVAAAMSQTFWTPVSEHEIYVAQDTPENRRQFERMSLRTYYVPEAKSDVEMNELVTAIRTLFDVRLINMQPAQSLLTVRGRRRALEGVTRFLEGLESGRPEVLVEVQVFQLNDTSLRNLGLQPPSEIVLFNVPTEAQALASQPGVQSAIDQLIASGGINQANTVAVAALLAQLGGQQSPLLQPFATFGGGTTLEGVNLGKLAVTASYDHARFQSLEHVTMRATQGSPATFFVGERFPVLNAIFSPIFNSAALTSVIQNGSFTAPFPSFTYEDLGISVKATPEIHADAGVTLEVEMAIKQLTGEQFNGIPVVGNREYKGAITLKDGEPAVVAGELDETTQHERTGPPGMGQLPLAGRFFSSETAQRAQSEILVVITPHILELPRQKSARSEIWLGPGDSR